MEDYRSISEELFQSRMRTFTAFSVLTDDAKKVVYAAFKADMAEIMHDFAATRTLSQEDLSKLEEINQQLLSRLETNPAEKDGTIGEVANPAVEI